MADKRINRTRLLKDFETMVLQLPSTSDVLNCVGLGVPADKRGSIEYAIERTFNKEYYSKLFLVRDCVAKGTGSYELHETRNNYHSTIVEVDRENEFLVALLYPGLFRKPWMALDERREAVKPCYREVVEQCALLRTWLAIYEKDGTFWDKAYVPAKKLQLWTKGILDEAFERWRSLGGRGPRWVNEARLYDCVRVVFHDAVFQYRADWLERMSLDIFIPSERIAIEYQGTQHYKDDAFFEGIDGFDERVLRDQKKRILCEMHDVKLVEYPHTKEMAIEDVVSFLERSIGRNISSELFRRQERVARVSDLLFDRSPMSRSEPNDSDFRAQQEIRKFSLDGEYEVSFSSIAEASDATKTDESEILAVLASGRSSQGWLLCRQDEALQSMEEGLVDNALRFGAFGSLIMLFNDAVLFRALPLCINDISINGNEIKRVGVVRPGERVLFVSSSGYCFTYTYEELSLIAWDDGKLLKAGQGFELSEIVGMEVLGDRANSAYLVVCSESGGVGKRPLSAIANCAKRPMPVSRDRVFGTALAFDGDYLVGVTHAGRSLIFPIDQVPAYKSVTATLVAGVTLKRDDSLRAFCSAPINGVQGGKWLFVSDRGFVKKCDRFDCRVDNRGEVGGKVIWGKNAGQTQYVIYPPEKGDIVVLGKSSSVVKVEDIPYSDLGRVGSAGIDLKGYPFVFRDEWEDAFLDGWSSGL